MNTNSKKYNSLLAIRNCKAVLPLVALFCGAVVLPSCSVDVKTETGASVSSESGSAAPSADASKPAADASKSEMTQKVEEALIKAISSQLPSPVTAANCPEVKETKAGTTFDCETKIAEGTFPTTVTFENDQGSLDFKSKNILVVPMVEKTLAESLKKQKKIEATVDCGTPKVKLVEKGATDKLACTLKGAGGKSDTVNLKISNETGKVDAQVE